MAKRRKRRGKGEGSVAELPSGSFRFEVPVGRDPETGKPLRLRRTFPAGAYADGLAWQADQRAKFKAGELAAPSRVTVAEYAERWLSLRRAGNLKAGTVGFYEGVVRPHLIGRLGHLRVSAVTVAVVEDWLVGMERAGVPADRRRKAASTLRAVLKAAGKDGLIRGNPAREVAKPKARRKPVEFWSEADARKVVAAAAGRRLGAMVVLALDGGFRVGELQALHWPEIDLAAGTVRVVRTLDSVTGEFTTPKTSKSVRTVAVSPGTVERLTAHRAEMAAEGRDVGTGLVFPAKRKGGPLPYDTFYRRYYGGVVGAAGVPWIGPHGMRHTCATMLLRAGVWVKVVSERLGHEDVQTTLRLYAHVIEGDQSRAVETVGRLLWGG